MANEKRRLIDAYTLAEEIESLTITVAGKPAKWNDAKHSVLRILEEQPDVEAVEVVRCRDCVSRVWDSEAKEYWCDNPFGLCAMLNDGDFCSYGERIDGE